MADVRMLRVGSDDDGIRVTLDELAREGARRMIAAALEAKDGIRVTDDDNDNNEMTQDERVAA